MPSNTAGPIAPFVGRNCSKRGNDMVTRIRVIPKGVEVREFVEFKERFQKRVGPKLDELARIRALSASRAQERYYP